MSAAGDIEAGLVEEVAVIQALTRYVVGTHGVRLDMTTRARLLLTLLRTCGLMVTPAPHLVGGRPAPPVLSARQLQTLDLMSRGLSNGAIGRELFVSEDTVKSHNLRLFRALGARDRAHAVRRGFELGLLS